MPNLSDYLDTDKVVQRATIITSSAMKRWVRGRLLTEEPLLSNLIYEFEDDDPRCVSARLGQVEARTAIRLLHRQGTGNTDLMGSDLAVTLMVRRGQGVALKSALFQLKKVYGSSGRVKIDRGQIDQVVHSRVTCGKAFVICADPGDESMRIQSCQALKSKFRKNAESHQPIPSEKNGWLTVSRWTELWMKCKEGQSSDPFDRGGLEAALLHRFAKQERTAAIAASMDLDPDPKRLGEFSEPLSNTVGWLFTSISLKRGEHNG